MNDHGLYRDPDNGKLAGVCAGIAQRFRIETWLVRIIAFTVAITNFGLFAIIYGAGWLFLEKKPGTESEQSAINQLKSKVWQRGDSPSSIIDDIDNLFKNLETRLQDLEKTVTSRDFDLKRKFKNL
ncbi:envelope stress response membrane protein PspC [Alginatibacterium sediminis]|uniref:Envelope stress response membrane protein PspC n=1 Tax=Alginatibacterium sediminis TaxID=2164068 RepID=A0A420EGH9_9ALTE|nr:envelope stress response membrane protein PspC [Alginatibacterium sediminis]RKF19821.1 envelope stress response membrane protein PspC [Alginatibacterium sediminis]